MPKKWNLLFLLIITTFPFCAFGSNDPNSLTPDNAAYWYRKAFESLDNFDMKATTEYFMSLKGQIKPGQDSIKIQEYLDFSGDIRKYTRGEIEINEEIRRYLNNNKQVVHFFMKASQCSYCDWGYGDFEHFSRSQCIPFINEKHKFSNGLMLLLADSVFSADKGEILQAEKKLSAAFLIYNHYDDFDGTSSYGIWDRQIISCIQHILPDIATHKVALTQLKRSLHNFIQDRPNREELFDERTEMLIKMIMQDKERSIKNVQNSNHMTLQGTFDPEYFQSYRERLKKIWLMPSKEAYPKIQQIEQDLASDIEKKKANKTPVDINSFLISIYDRDITSHYWADILYRSMDNATYIASAVYLYYISNGQLPPKLPSNMPKDPFSDKPFQLIKTADGFKLKCQGEDLRTNKFHEYEFTLPKD